MAKARSSVREILILSLLVALTTACSDASPTRPSRAPLGSGAAAPARIELMTPQSVVPGTSALVTLMAYFDDGSVRDVTAAATYASSDTSILAFVAPGRLSAAAAGEATISVTYLGLCIARLMFAMPRGTFRLVGTVSDEGLAVGGAEVRVLSGAGTGLSALTTETGHYRLYGVAGDTRIEVRKDRYTIYVETIDIGENTQHDVELTPEAVPTA
jgi:hypothetical protein